jgi:hypothetical protein
MSIKIFLSTVSDEFRDYRDQLRSDLMRHNVEVKVQEDFKDSDGVRLDKLDLYISFCDAVIHLVGDMTGGDAKPASTATIVAKYPDIAERLPPLRGPLDKGLGISYTQWEAWLALYHGKPLLIAMADDAAPRGPNFLPTDRSYAAQRAHLAMLSEIGRYPGVVFKDPTDLARSIASSTILDLIVMERRGGALPQPDDGKPRGLPKLCGYSRRRFFLLIAAKIRVGLSAAFSIDFRIILVNPRCSSTSKPSALGWIFVKASKASWSVVTCLSQSSARNGPARMHHINQGLSNPTIGFGLNSKLRLIKKSR